MQEQLRRIKNKDLSSLDERLFGNLDKVETINSTIENLGQFQQFLLKQISQFEEKAMTKNKSKQVAEVIEQNCLTLRESIMNIIPDDLQSSRSRMRQTVTSPINGFRSTRGFKKDVHQQESFRVHEGKERQLAIKIEQLQLALKNSTKRQDELKQSFNKVKIDNLKFVKQIDSLTQQNTRLKQQYRRIKQQNNNLNKQFAIINYQSQQKKQRNIQQLFENPLLMSTQLSKPTNSVMRKSQVKQSLHAQSQQSQFMSFKDKMKFDFTSKLSNYDRSEVRVRDNLDQSQKIEGSDTFRESNTIELAVFESTCKPHNGQFKSIEVSRNYDSDLDPNVPKLLKRNSISSHYHSSNVSEQAIGSRHRVPLSTYDSNIGIRSQYQSAQKIRQIKHQISTSKKVNHDLMRKTKSNFFKQPIENKQNTHAMDTFYDTNIAKIKGLVNQSNPNERKRNSQSKQKLKIFSMM